MQQQQAEARPIPVRVVYRQLAIPVPAFDHIKDTQRAREAATGRRWSINETVAAIVAEHQTQQQKTVEREARDHDRQAPRTSAICR